MKQIRQPIVTVAGHVDHGKTTILDSIRKTKVYNTEAGGITQKISFTLVPMDELRKRSPLIKDLKLEIPGFLFIDTPGHAAFSHLRKRGGSLADLAILVMDINEGIMPQTQEVIEILKINKTPFIVALNKIDNISGWRKQADNLKDSIEKQSTNVRLAFDEKLFTIMGALHHHGFNAKPFYEITDFASKLALIPVSGKTGEGIPELIMMFCGLSNKFLKENLKLSGTLRGVVLEIKKEKTIQYAEAIIYDGKLKITDELAIASFGDPIITKIRILEEILPISSRFKTKEEVTASTGIRMQLINSQEILPGMPFRVLKDNIKEIKEEFKKEVGENIKTDKEGIIAKADSLGSLEALITLLRKEKISIIKAGIGNITKKDVISAQTNLKNDPMNALIVGFNVEEDEDVKSMDIGKIKIIKNDVIYRLIEDLLKFQKEKEQEIKRDKLLELSSISHLKILHQYVFRNLNPAVFGVRVEGGKLKANIKLMDADGEKITKVKAIQNNKIKVVEATKGMKVAISLPGINFERQLKDKTDLYSDISENQFKEFKDNKDILTQEEIQILQKISQIKRKQKPTWGV